jgi:hypothetical protein
MEKFTAVEKFGFGKKNFQHRIDRKKFDLITEC